MKNYREKCISLLSQRGVTLEDIAEASRFLQSEYRVNLQKEELMASIMSVLAKREVQFAIMTAVELDTLAERKMFLNKDLEDVIRSDEGLYGVDEVLAYGICNLYGSIALTNFGYIDKRKYGIVQKLNDLGKEDDHCHTFLDDIVGAIAAAAASRFAHDVREE